MGKKQLFLLICLGFALTLYAEDQMLIYCGTTMKKPVQELADRFAAEEGVEVLISFGGSGNLLRSIQTNRVGDLFLPGSDSYIKEMQKTEEVVATGRVGRNRAALMVAEGNPLAIDSLDVLSDPDYFVVLAKSTSGSIGKEAKKILDTKGVYEEVMENCLYLTTDSKDLVSAIETGDADVTVNWYATASWPENSAFMDAVPIPEAVDKSLVFGVLSYSADQDRAVRFLELATSPEGIGIFNRYGFGLE